VRGGRSARLKNSLAPGRSPRATGPEGKGLAVGLLGLAVAPHLLDFAAGRWMIQHHVDSPPSLSNRTHSPKTHWKGSPRTVQNWVCVPASKPFPPSRRRRFQCVKAANIPNRISYRFQSPGHQLNKNDSSASCCLIHPVRIPRLILMATRN